MKVVLDTNVLVSALLSSRGAPAGLLFLLVRGTFEVLVDERIIEEYREVLSRPRFALGEAATAVLAFLEAKGEEVEPEPYLGALPDEDDRPFVEVALSGDAEAIVTGNAKDFPEGIGVPVLSPAAFLRLLEEEAGGAPPST